MLSIDKSLFNALNTVVVSKVAVTNRAPSNAFEVEKKDGKVCLVVFQ